MPGVSCIYCYLKPKNRNFSVPGSKMLVKMPYLN